MLNPARMGGEAGENRLLIPSESCGCPPPAPPLAPGPVPRRLRRRGGARFVAAGKDRPLRNGRVGEAEARRSDRSPTSGGSRSTRPSPPHGTPSVRLVFLPSSDPREALASPPCTQRRE